MSVIVKGMEMPDNCGECRLMVDYWCYAKPVNGQPGPTFMEKRPDWCPLRPLPNVHGDLIDRDALPSRVEWEDIVNAPAIVGAEGEEPIKITGKIYFVDGHVYIDPDKEDKP